MNGVTSKGIFSRAESSATGLAFSSSTRSFHGSSLTRAPIGKRRDLVEFVGLQLRRRSHQLSKAGDAVAEMRTDQAPAAALDSASSCFRKRPALPSLSLYGEFFSSSTAFWFASCT